MLRELNWTERNLIHLIIRRTSKKAWAYPHESLLRTMPGYSGGASRPPRTLPNLDMERWLINEKKIMGED